MHVHLLDKPHRVLILGANHGGATMLELLMHDELADVVGVVDRNPEAPGIRLAREQEIPVFTDVGDACRNCSATMILNLTNNPDVDTLVASTQEDAVIVGGNEAMLMWRMLTRLRHDQSLVFRLVSRLKRSQERQRYEASHDFLTDLYNRRFLMEQLQNGLAQALRYRIPYTLLLMDVDHFKQINDTHGHAAGDTILKEFAACLRRNMRSADVLGRFGGDEFLVLLPHTSVEHAQLAARKWIAEMVRQGIHLPGKGAIDVTFSGGVAGYDGTADVHSAEVWVDRLLAEADTNLYRAKSLGRNRVEQSQESAAVPQAE